MESASKQKHPRRSGNEHTIPAPVVPILWDRIISHTSQQQRFQIYGPLKLAIKNQRSCSFSRLKRLLRTPPTRGLTRAPTGALTGRIDWLWSGRNRHQARGGQTARSGARLHLVWSKNHPDAVLPHFFPHLFCEQIGLLLRRLLHASNTIASLWKGAHF